jgi:hypothetical protein
MRRLALLAALPLLALTVLLTPHALAQDMLDQSVTTPPTGQAAIVQVAPAFVYGQTFTAGSSGLLAAATLALSASSAGTTASVGLYATTGAGPNAVPTGAALATGVVTVQQTTPPTSAAQFTTVTFASPAAVVAGQVYALVLGPVQTPLGSLLWSYAGGNPYLAGTALQSFTGVNGPYQPLPTIDFDFQTFVTPPTPAAAPVVLVVTPTVSLGIAIKGCGSSTPSAATTVVNLFQAIPVTAVPCPGSVFVGWTGGPCNGTRLNPCDIAPTGTTIITATFAP